MSKHTPGDWVCIGGTASYLDIIGNVRFRPGLPDNHEQHESGVRVCRVHRHAPAEANVALICAAPLLLEACQAVPRILYGLALDERQAMVAQQAIDQCRAALAAARGETE